MKRVLKRPMAEIECRFYLKDIIEGVEYLHKGKNIAHRDLKLSNILIANNQDIKIADFGLAVNISDIYQDKNIICGTPNYISPEMLCKQKYTFSVDMWSIGVITYILLIGKSPFEGSNVDETFRNIKNSEPRLPSNLSGSARDFISSLLIKNPDVRLSIDDIKSHSFLNEKLLKEINIDFGKEDGMLDNITLDTIYFVKPSKYLTKIGILKISNSIVVLESKFGLEVLEIDTISGAIKLRREDCPKEKFGGFLCIYRKADLPVPFRLIHKMVYRFVESLKAKTVSLTLKTEAMSSYLMSNSPHFNMKTIFKRPGGITTKYIPRKRLVIIIKGPDERHKDVKTYYLFFDNIDSEIPVEMLKLVSHVLKYYSLCTELYKKSIDSGIPLPVVYEKTPYERNDPNQNDWKSLEMSELMSALSFQNQGNAYLKRDMSSEFEIYQQADYKRHKEEYPRHRSHDSNCSETLIEDLSQDENGVFLLIFSDGTKLQINPENSTCLYSSNDYNSQMFRKSPMNYKFSWTKINEHLSADVKERLALFYKLMSEENIVL